MQEDERYLQWTVHSGQRRIKRRPQAQSCANLINRWMAHYGIAQGQWADQLESAVTEALGTDLTGQARPGQLKRGCLEIIVDNSSVLQQLSFKKQALLDHLRSSLPEANIKNIRFRVGNY